MNVNGYKVHYISDLLQEHMSKQHVEMVTHDTRAACCVTQKCILKQDGSCRTPQLMVSGSMQYALLTQKPTCVNLQGVSNDIIVSMALVPVGFTVVV